MHDLDVRFQVVRLAVDLDRSESFRERVALPLTTLPRLLVPRCGVWFAWRAVFGTPACRALLRARRLGGLGRLVVACS